MPVHSTEISVYARYDELPRLQGKIASWSESAGLPQDSMFRLQLVIEELFTNTIAHGHCGECEADVLVCLRSTGNDLCLRYSDEGPPFDTAQPTATQTPGEKIGGVGRELLQGLSKTLHYWRTDGRNITELQF